MAADYTRGLSGGSGGVAVRRDVVYNRLTHLASLSGNHVVGGRLLYLHTDGSVSLAVGGEQACSCGYVHQ